LAPKKRTTHRAVFSLGESGEFQQIAVIAERAQFASFGYFESETFGEDGAFIFVTSVPRAACKSLSGSSV